MSGLLGLPAELRQQILFLAVPQIITVSPATAHPIRNFLLICKRLKQDLEEIAGRLDLEYIVADPSHMHCIREAGPPITRITRLTLQIFSPATVSTLLNQVYSILLSSEIDRILLEWTHSLAPGRSPLPKTGLKRVAIDIGPIPSNAQDKSKPWLAWTINHPLMASLLFSTYEAQVADVVVAVGKLLKITAQRQQPELRVIGTLSPQTRDQMPTVMDEISKLNDEGVNVMFDPEWVAQSRAPKWKALLEHLQVEYEKTPAGSLRQSRETVKQLLHRAFKRDKNLGRLFNERAFADPESTWESVVGIAKLAADETTSTKTPTGFGTHNEQIIVYGSLKPLDRALLHRIAEILRLPSEAFRPHEVHGVRVKDMKIKTCYDVGYEDNYGLENDLEAAKQYDLLEDR